MRGSLHGGACVRRILLALLVVCAAIAGSTVGVAGQSDDGVLGDFLDDEDDGTNWSERVSALASGAAAKASWYAGQALSLSDADADQEAAEADREDLQQEFNANNESIENYMNTRFDGNASKWDVIAVHHIRDDGEATHYIVADGNGSAFSNARMVDATDRSVDKEVTLSDYASDNAATELETFIGDFVEEDKGVTSTYLQRLAHKYSGYVETPEGFENAQ